MHHGEPVQPVGVTHKVVELLFKPAGVGMQLCVSGLADGLITALTVVELKTHSNQVVNKSAFAVVKTKNLCGQAVEPVEQWLLLALLVLIKLDLTLIIFSFLRMERPRR